MDFTNPDWRVALFAAVVIVAIYLGYALLRLLKSRIGLGRPTPPAASVADEALMRGVQTELIGLRAQVDSLQADVGTLRDEIERFKAARGVSPQYNDALMFAQKGMSAEAIAEKCGISVGEAELVCALARTQSGNRA